jgi:phosphotriesterase-related protein
VSQVCQMSQLRHVGQVSQTSAPAPGDDGPRDESVTEPRGPDPSAAAPQIQTVLGPIDPDELGITHCHEHLLVDLGPIVSGYDAILYDERLAAEELASFASLAGPGRAVVELTSLGIGRDPAGLRRISAATGVHVIMGAGWYREAVYGPEVFERSTAELADLIARDVLEGVPVGADGRDDAGRKAGGGEDCHIPAPTGDRIYAGVIGEIGTGRRGITPAEERVFRAAARAQRRTGVALFTHTTHFGELALEQLGLLAEEGIDPQRVVIGHLGDRRGIETLLPIAEKGAVLSIDNVGYREYQSDEQRAANVAALVAEGFLGQIVLASDICQLSHLRAYNGKGYDHLLRLFVPLLHAHGLTGAQVRTMLVDNPRRVLARQSAQPAAVGGPGAGR